MQPAFFQNPFGLGNDDEWFDVDDVKEWLGSTLEGISGWVDQQRATGGSPPDNLGESRSQFDEQLALAQGGDREALQSITQYADRLLSSSQEMFASGPDAQAEREKVLAALEDLPDAVSAEQYIADEIKQALREQTSGITDRLGEVLVSGTPTKIAEAMSGSFEELTRGVGGVLTREQLATVMQGKATDAQIDALMGMVDLNGDGIISGLESVIIKSLPSDTLLSNVIKNQLGATRNKQLTHAQVRSALAPIATDKQINALIERVDVNGDGIITEQELVNARISQLAVGIGNTLKPMFDGIDLDLDGVIDYEEFGKQFAGMASDAELKRIFHKLDVNGDGTISAIEAGKASTDEVSSNTKPLEDSARDQLATLNGLVEEMSRSTDQFVGLNTTMISLRDSINALGVAQAEVARIEKARQEAEAAAKKRIDLERKLAGYESTMGDIESRLEGSKGDVSKLSKDRDTYSYVDKESRHGQLLWDSMTAEYKGYKGYIGDEAARWKDGKLRPTGNEEERYNVFRLHKSLSDAIQAFSKATGHGSEKKLELDEVDFYGEGDSRNRFQIEYGGKTYYAGYNSKGIQSFEDAWDAMQSALNKHYGENFDWRAGDDIRRKLSDAESSLESLLNDRDSTQEKIEALNGQIESLKVIEQFDGSHAAGLDNVPFDGYRAELHKGELVATASQAPAVRSFLDGGLPPVSLPPLLGKDDAIEVLRDMQREMALLRRENKELLGRIEQHGGAAVAVQQAGFQRQISEQQRGNRSLDEMRSSARLEASR